MALNLYGDRLNPTTGVHGSDIASQRMDELDQACAEFVQTVIAERGECRTVDIGGGSGAQAKRLAKLGAQVLLVDLTDQADAVQHFNIELGRSAVGFVRGDVRQLAPQTWPEAIGCVYSQRMLGCIRYHESLALLQTLKGKASQGARFFLSTGGLDTEYGRDYPDRNKPVDERYALFSPEMAEKHGITSPECLYREQDLRQLAKEAGLKLLRSWTSPFGNPKLIAAC